jgi:YVTN family beta-propeller protein
MWAVADTTASLFPLVVDDPDLLLVDRFQPQPGGGGRFVTSTQARNARTGALLWELSDRSVMDVTSELTILMRQDSADGTAAGSAVRSHDVVEAVDRRTGTPRWSIPAGAGAVWGVDMDERPDGDRLLVQLQPSGLLRIIDAATNTVQRTARLPLAGRPFRVTTRGGLAVIQQFRPDQGSGRADLVAAYDLATGGEVWRHDDADFPVLCGDHYFCEYGTNNSWVIDPDTGGVAYRRPGNRFRLAGDRLFLWQGGRVIASDGGAALIDLRTGRTVRSFGRWRIVADNPERGLLVARIGLTGPITLGVLNPGRGTVTVVGHGPRWLGDPDCAWGPAYVGCAGPGGVQIWRLP